MKVLAAAAAGIFGIAVTLLSPPLASADPGGPSDSPPFIDHTEWAQSAGLSSLRVYPTSSGRSAARQSGTAALQSALADEAWTEVLALSPDADSPGMRTQFICHWRFVEFARPGKTSWNLEPWRPVVDDAEMVASGCNPGGAEGQF